MILATFVAVALTVTAPYDVEKPTEIKPIENIAQEVVDGLWGNGSTRKEKLKGAGYDWQEVQELVNTLMPEDTGTNRDKADTGRYSEWIPDPDGSVLTARGGINYYFDQYETYYNLDMTGVIKIARAHGIGGEYWVRDDGAKMLGDYIMLATNNDVYPIGTLVPCSLGMGISLDTGSFAERNPYQIDIAVSW